MKIAKFFFSAIHKMDYILEFFGLNSVFADKVSDTAKLAKHGNIKQNSSLETSDDATFGSREIGTPWHPSDLGVGKILGLQGKKLTNTSHVKVGMESFYSRPGVERTPVTDVHTPPSQQVLPAGPVDASVDFTGLRGEISTGTPSFGKSGGPSGGGFGGGNGLASADIRDLIKNKRNYNSWARHGGVDPTGGTMHAPTPPYLEKTTQKKMQLNQQYPKKVSNATAQGFFD